MSAQNKVWAVSDGEYSSYSVIALFAEEADAQAAVQAGFGDRVEDFEYYSPGQRPVHCTYYRANATIDAKTGELNTHGYDPDKDQWGPISDLAAYPHQPRQSTEWRHPTMLIHRAETEIREWNKGYINHFWQINVAAVTEELARKVLHDLVAKTRSEILEGLR